MDPISKKIVKIFMVILVVADPGALFTYYFRVTWLAIIVAM